MDIAKLNEFKKLLDDDTISEADFFKLKSDYIARYKEYYNQNISKIELSQTPEVKINDSNSKLNNLASTLDFWYEFHKSLKLSYSWWNNSKHYSLDEWIAECWDSHDMLQHLKVLYNYPLIKGEFLLCYYSGFILTNYRLIINDSDAGSPSIPLTDVKSYCNNNSGIIKYQSNGKEFQLQYQSFLDINIVNGAIKRNQGGSLSLDERYFLSKSRADVSQEKSFLVLPALDMMPRPSNIKKISNQDDSKKYTRSLIIAIAIGIIGLVIAFNVRSVSGFMFTFITVGASFIALIVLKILFWIAEQFNFDSPKFKLASVSAIVYIVFFIGYSGSLSYTEHSEQSEREEREERKERESKSSSSSNNNYSGGSSYASSKSCSYCGSSFSGNGYNYVGGECGSGSSSYYSKCSMKCCNESRNNDKNLKKNYNIRSF